jgi:hypothetical protein
MVYYTHIPRKSFQQRIAELEMVLQLRPTESLELWLLLLRVHFLEKEADGSVCGFDDTRANLHFWDFIYCCWTIDVIVAL